MNEKIILASGSPRRREILSSMGVKFNVISADVDESVSDGTPPDKMVAELSARKAAAVAEMNPDGVVVGSDTVVYLDEENIILGKPKDEEDAARMLRMLSGRRHYVYTGVSVIRNGNTVTDVCVTGVDFREMTDEEIQKYIKTGEPSDKAGAYGVQGVGGIFVTGVVGDFFCVVGLPKSMTARLLACQGVDVLG